MLARKFCEGSSFFFPFNIIKTSEKAVLFSVSIFEITPLNSFSVIGMLIFKGLTTISLDLILTLTILSLFPGLPGTTRSWPFTSKTVRFNFLSTSKTFPWIIELVSNLPIKLWNFLSFIILSIVPLLIFLPLSIKKIWSEFWELYSIKW